MIALLAAGLSLLADAPSSALQKVEEAITAQRIDCDNAMTQRAMNICSYQDYLRADTELNLMWKERKAKAKSWGLGKELLASQRAWLKYRDAHCDLVAAQYEGGSIMPLVHNSCMAKLTRERIAALRELAN